MHTNKTQKALTIFVTIIMIVAMLLPYGGVPSAKAAPSVPVTFTILHTNDFHGQLEPSGSNPGMARTAAVINGVRTAKGAGNVLLFDAGDSMQGSLLSNLGDGTPTGKGIPTVATYNAMGYNAATFGNHEFDWGQVNLANRTTEAAYPFVTANIVQNDTGNCATAGWTPPAFVDAPYQILTVGSPVSVKVAVIGVSTTETPIITISTATAGLCFKDPAESIIRYYNAMKVDGADVIVVISHLGNTDSGGGYGLPVYGDQTLAAKLNTAGKPVNLIVGGHSHTDLSAAQTVGTTKVVQAHYNGRKVGQADITVGTDGNVTVNWMRLTVSTTGAVDAEIQSVINTYALDPDYLALVNTPIGYSAVDLGRSNTGDNMMATFIDDAIYNQLNTDAEPANDVDLFFNNAGGIRTDWCYVGGVWVNTGCVSGVHAPALLTYGNMFTVLPFGNATITGKMTGAQILEVINNGPLIAGVIQPAGLKYKYYKYTDTLAPGSTTSPYIYAWGAYDVQVYDKGTSSWLSLDLKKIYNVGTNEFLAPGGGDGYNAFKYMTNIMSWGDMLNAVNAYVSTNYGTLGTAYTGPNGDGTLDGRILRDGDGDNTYEPGEIVPLTILHHNDSHGNMYKGSFVGYTQLATLINQEKLHNPGRTLLLSSGDNIQGDGFSFYFKTAPTGYTSDGTLIPDVPDSMHIQPLIKVFNTMGYDAMVLGNHEYNFGKDVFTSVLSQAAFPLLQANVTEDLNNPYGLEEANIQPYVEKDLGDIDVAILGIGNHRVPNYELPSNIPGLTFSDPIAKAQELSDLLSPTNDVVIALTHIGFTEDPKSVEVDKNVDTNLVASVSGLDALVGGHSHTNPATGFGAYKYLPTIIAGADGKPAIVGHAYRYNNTLGEIFLGLRPLGGGDYEVVSQTGRFFTVSMSTVEDAATKAIVDPYLALFSTYNNAVLGQTTVPIDALQAFTQETNGANLQADAAVYELETKNGIPVDFHLSGAMTNRAVATAGPYPVSLKVADMFTLMPYENSLVVMEMNGPQLKAVLERAYRNYYYYKYVPGYGGYSYYTTCMLDTNSIGRIYYKDTNPALPDGNNVMGLIIDGKAVDFTDATKFYNVSTVNYLAAGSCNFNDGGVSLWPLNQIVHDTQYYVRDAVIDYITAKGTVSPAIEGRLLFGDTNAPVVTINSPLAQNYLHPGSLTLDFSAVDGPDSTTPSFAAPSGVKSIQGTLDGTPVTTGQVIDLYTLLLGNRVLTVTAVDYYGNTTTQSVTFSVTATIQSTIAGINRFYTEGEIDNKGIANSLTKKLENAQKSLDKGKIETAINQLNAFINEVQAQSGKHITADAAAVLIADAQWVINYPK